MATPSYASAQYLTSLTTKLYIPPPRPNLVPRPRLIQRLGKGLCWDGKPVRILPGSLVEGRFTMMSDKFLNWKNLMVLGSLLALLLAWDPGSVEAQGEASDPIPAIGLSDPAEIEAFWDEYFPRQLERYNVPGAVMVMVKDGEILFAKGYGYADLANRIPFDPGRTILRGGSIVKTVTAMAILQLAEVGKVDLDADINNYLSLFKVPDTFPEPVTARQLINMTGGFDTRWIGTRAPSQAELISLGEYLAQRMPPRTQPPGRYRRYNDNEVALAGYQVEVVSGVPYEEYVGEHIFEPLEMDSSSVLLPADQLDRVALGYPIGGRGEEAFPLSYYYLHNAPGAGFNTSAMDIAHYMIAHLEDGRYTRGDGTVVRVLQEETARFMHQTAFAYRPQLAGQANTFDEDFYNGHRYLVKHGGAPGMHNLMLLLKEQGMGFYLFYNHDRTALRNDWWHTVEEMYLSAPAMPPVFLDPLPDAAQRAAHYAGYYLQQDAETADANIVKVNALITPGYVQRVKINSDGSLRIGRGGPYIEVEPGLFQNQESGSFTAFETDADDRVTSLFIGRSRYACISWLETPPVQLGLLAFAALTFLSGAIAWLVGLARRQARGRWLSGLVSSVSV